jgi:mannose-6-phosphate isomerase class I
MKNILLAMITVMGVATLVHKKPQKKVKPQLQMAKVDGAGMAFVSETIDYGTIAHNADGQREFVFNNGTKPLIITNTQGSCGCTVPTSQKSQLLQGQKVLLV